MNLLEVKLAVTIVAVLLLSSCASRPASISASYVPFQKYTSSDCPHLAMQRTEAEAALERVCDKQNSKANGDAVGVFLIGVPFSQLSGDYAGEVARCKGEVEAINTAQIVNKCFDQQSHANNQVQAVTPPQSVHLSEKTKSDPPHWP